VIGHVTTFLTETPNVGELVIRHLQLSFVPVAAAFLLAFPLGLFIGHSRRWEFVTVTLANWGRAVPSFAILSLALVPVIRLGIEDFGFWATFVALLFLSLPPIVVNTYTGVKGVEPDLVEAAAGQGLSGLQVLRQVELPLAAPLVVAGVRVAAVQSVATATLGGLVAAGGLGDPIVLGFRASDNAALLGGAFLVAVVAIVTELAFAVLERFTRPRGVRGTREARPIRNLAEARIPPGAPSIPG